MLLNLIRNLKDIRDVIKVVVAMIKALLGESYRDQKEFFVELRNGTKIPMCGKGLYPSRIVNAKPHRLKEIIKVNESKEGYEYTFKHKGITYITHYPNTWIIEDPNKTYIEPVERILKRPPKQIIDIGAYTGDSMIAFKSRWPDVEIYLIEPVHRNVELIKRNIEGNNLKNVTIIPKGIGLDGHTTIKSSEEEGSASFGLDLDPARSKEYRLETISLNDLLKDHDKVDLVKMDCEGCEKYLLKTPNEVIEKCKLWIIELHSKELKEKIIALFERLGYQNEKLEEIDDEVSIYLFYKL